VLGVRAVAQRAAAKLTALRSRARGAQLGGNAVAPRRLAAVAIRFEDDVGERAVQRAELGEVETVGRVLTPGKRAIRREVRVRRGERRGGVSATREKERSRDIGDGASAVLVGRKD
jgi:hypothetical protein